MPDNNFFHNYGPFDLNVIAEKISAKLILKNNVREIIDISTLSSAQPGELTFLTNSKYSKYLQDTKASVCIVDEASVAYAPPNLSLLVHPDPHGAHALVANLFYPCDRHSGSVSPTSSISKTATLGKDVTIEDFVVIKDGATIGDGCYIGAGCVIDKNVIIGAGTSIMNNCSVSYAHIGGNCMVYSGVRIGQDGFGFPKGLKGIVKIPQLGRVIIGNNVEIGANSCIDRGTLEDTIIKDDTKIDNLVQIGHNSIIGKSCIICGQVGIAGTSKVGDYVMLGGQVGVAGHLEIASGTMVAAQSGVISNVPTRTILGGTPAVPIREWHKGNIVVKQLIKRGGNKS